MFTISFFDSIFINIYDGLIYYLKLTTLMYISILLSILLMKTILFFSPSRIYNEHNESFNNVSFILHNVFYTMIVDLLQVSIYFSFIGVIYYILFHYFIII